MPTADAPFGSLDSGDTVAMLGRESAGPDGEQGALSLIGVLQLEFVQGDNVYYVVTPDEALQIKSTVDRYARASDRTMLKLGFDLRIEDLVGRPRPAGDRRLVDQSGRFYSAWPGRRAHRPMRTPVSLIRRRAPEQTGGFPC